MSNIARLLLVVASLWLAAMPARAQADLILGVSEGTSGGLDHAQVIAKYGGVASALGKALNRRVVVVFVREFSMLDDGIKRGTLDLVLARPSDYPARAMRDNGYQFVASAKPDGQCLVIVADQDPGGHPRQALGGTGAGVVHGQVLRRRVA
jgi:ABC-type phosphate/phosphonate transport system substrate-binding protein